MKVKEVAEFLKVSTADLLKLLKNVAVGQTYTEESDLDKNLEKKLAKYYGVPYPFKTKAKPAAPKPAPSKPVVPDNAGKAGKPESKQSGAITGKPENKQSGATTGKPENKQPAKQEKPENKQPGKQGKPENKQPGKQGKPENKQPGKQGKPENNNSQVCLSKGIMVEAEEVHHKVPLSEGGTHARENLVCLCASCHSRLHAERGDRWSKDRQYSY